MCELLWSDPEDINDWAENPRGAGVIFGTQLVEKFLNINRVGLIVRAHQLIMEGFRKQFNDKLITVWSAPNYCYRCQNKASIMKLGGNLDSNFIIFEASKEDYKPPPKKKDLPEYFL
jgi:serine/threonine-protein phosphatase 4 catalytic subunit